MAAFGRCPLLFVFSVVLLFLSIVLLLKGLMDSVIWIENVAEPNAEVASAGSSQDLVNAVCLCFTTHMLRRVMLKNQNDAK